MTNNVQNQQEEQNQTAEKEWIVKLAPIFATLVPASESGADLRGNYEHYVDITKLNLLKNIGNNITTQY